MTGKIIGFVNSGVQDLDPLVTVQWDDGSVTDEDIQDISVVRVGDES